MPPLMVCFILQKCSSKKNIHSFLAKNGNWVSKRLTKLWITKKCQLHFLNLHKIKIFESQCPSPQQWISNQCSRTQGREKAPSILIKMENICFFLSLIQDLKKQLSKNFIFHDLFSYFRENLGKKKKRKYFYINLFI